MDKKVDSRNYHEDAFYRKVWNLKGGKKYFLKTNKNKKEHTHKKEK